jgi:hypothetical protein
MALVQIVSDRPMPTQNLSKFRLKFQLNKPSPGLLSFLPKSAAPVPGKPIAAKATVALFYEGKPTSQSGGLAGTRTPDQCLKRALLYQLSYQPIMF